MEHDTAVSASSDKRGGKRPGAGRPRKRPLERKANGRPPKYPRRSIRQHLNMSEDGFRRLYALIGPLPSDEMEQTLIISKYLERLLYEAAVRRIHNAGAV